MPLKSQVLKTVINLCVLSWEICQESRPIEHLIGVAIQKDTLTTEPKVGVQMKPKRGREKKL